MDGSVDFYRSWQTYKEGFGKADGEYWLGNRRIFETIININDRYDCQVKLLMHARDQKMIMHLNNDLYFFFKK